MRKEEQIRDELAVLKRNLENHPDKDAWIKLYKKLPSEDRQLLILAQSPTLMQEQIAAFEWVLKDPYEEPPLKSYVVGGEIPYEIAHKLEMYQGRNIHDVRATTYKLRNAYKEGNSKDIEKHLKMLRTMVNGI